MRCPKFSVPLLLLAALTGTARASEYVEPPSDLASLSGTWSVTLTLATGGLTGACSASLAYQWILTVDPDGLASASVLGETGFPKLKGELVGDPASWSGYVGALKAAPVGPRDGSAKLYENAEFTVSGSKEAFTGTRTWSGYAEATDGGRYPIACTWSVAGKHL